MQGCSLLVLTANADADAAPSTRWQPAVGLKWSSHGLPWPKASGLLGGMLRFTVGRASCQCPVSTDCRCWCSESEQLLWGRNSALPCPVNQPDVCCHSGRAATRLRLGPAILKKTSCYRRGRHLSIAHDDSLGGGRQSRNVGSAANRLREGGGAAGDGAVGGAVPFSCRSVSPLLSKTSRAALSAIQRKELEPLDVTVMPVHT